MDNNKSSYSLMLKHATIAILAIVSLIGAVTVTATESLYKKSKLEELSHIGNYFCAAVREAYNYGENDYFSCGDSLQRIITSEYDGIKIYMYDENGNCCMASDENDIPTLKNSIMTTLDQSNEFIELNPQSFSSSEPHMVYGSKIFLRADKVNSGTFHTPYVVIYGDTNDLNIFMMQVAVVYIICAMITVLISWLIMKFRFNKYIKFEKEFIEISEKYSKGDFSKKITTDIGGVGKEIAEYVNTLAADVEKSEETSKTFIANVSHELRTPITTIGGFVDGILDGTIKKSQQQEYLVIVSKEIKRLSILISSMLNMTKFESGTLVPNFRETNLTDLVIQIVLMFEKRMEEKHLQLEELNTSRLVAVVDPDLMQQVIYNLIENAVKFVNEGGTLSFSFYEENETCIIGIKNTGEGLKDEEIEQVFDRFYKTDSSRGKDAKGLGLGLSISRKIVHLHNGHIVVKSVYGEYTEFQVQIPRDLTKNKENPQQ